MDNKIIFLLIGILLMWVMLSPTGKNTINKIKSVVS
jgi:hypothetical protein